MKRFFTDAWFIASRDLGTMLRQKETVLWVFLMPILFFFFIGTVTGGSSTGSKPDQPIDLAVVGSADGGFLQDELYAAIEGQGYTLLHFSDPAEAAPYVRRLIMPQPAQGTSNFSESLLAGNPAVLRLERKSTGSATNLDKLRLSRAIYTLLANLAVLQADGEPLDQARIDALQDMPRALSLHVETAGKRRSIPTGYSQAIPGTMIMFTLLVLLTSGGILLVIERKNGLLRRLASTPVTRGSIVMGKWIGRMILGTIQIIFAMLAGRVLFGMDWGPDLPMVLVVLVAWAAFCTSAAILLANLVRTEQQMSGIGVITAIVLAALGGCWWPIEVTPSWMQRLASVLPTGWAMDAMHQLIHFGNGPRAVYTSLGLLLAGTGILAILSVRFFRYE